VPGQCQTVRPESGKLQPGPAIPPYPSPTSYRFFNSRCPGSCRRGFRRYAWCMRYVQGGGLTAEGRRRREQVRLEAVESFEWRAPAAVMAAELRVSERSVRRWRRAWEAGGLAGLASRGPAPRQPDNLRHPTPPRPARLITHGTGRKPARRGN
jgi:hypothetical protein